MRFIADSNILGPTVDLLRTIFSEHEFATTLANGVEDMDDIPLFSFAAEHGYNAIITKDREQWRDLNERAALDESGLHWIGHRTKDHSGLRGLALQAATVISGLAFVLADWRTDPHIYLLKGVEALPSQRLTVVQTRLAENSRSTDICVP